MKKIIAVLICALFVGHIYAQSKTSLNTHSSVVFPTEPLEMKDKGMVMHLGYLDKNEKILGMAIAVDLGQDGIDSSFFNDKTNDSLFTALIVHNLGTKMDGATLVSKAKAKVGNSRGLDLEYKIDNPTEDFPYKSVYMRGVFEGTNSYLLFVVSNDGTTAFPLKNQFFNSLKID